VTRRTGASTTATGRCQPVGRSTPRRCSRERTPFSRSATCSTRTGRWESSDRATRWAGARTTAAAHPTPGNHEYGTSNAAGYFAYFGAAAGNPRRGYDSFDLGNWHLIALNSECDNVGGCAAGSPQEVWLRNDLAGTSKLCVVAYWHKPRFSSGLHGNDASYDAFWQALYAARADAVLVAHDHDYERFALQNPAAQADAGGGIREFVVGTGGKSHYPFAAIRPNSQVRDANTYGVLRLTLRPTGYDWRFVAESGTFTDSGSTACHPAAPPVVALTSFSARRTSRGVGVRWRTRSEIRALGFDLYRERAGRRGRVRQMLIPAAGTTRGHV
jgi:calcineurin-like phosphoesterase family protein